MSYDRSKSGLTALSSKTRPNKHLVELFDGSFKDVNPKSTKVLDFGAGNGRHSIAIRDLGYSVYSYDPYNGNIDADPYREVSAMTPRGNLRFGVVFTAFVLNVVDYTEMLEILHTTEHYTQKGGYTVHAVREDLRRLKGSQEISGKGSIQRDIPVAQLTDLGYTRLGKLFIKERG